MTEFKELNMKKQSYAGTEKAAEKLVVEAKEDKHLVSWKISEKHNRYGEYFLIDLAYSYNTPKEIMEGNPEAPEDPHKGIEYAVDVTTGVADVKEEDKKEEVQKEDDDLFSAPSDEEELED